VPGVAAPLPLVVPGVVMLPLLVVLGVFKLLPLVAPGVVMLLPVAAPGVAALLPVAPGVAVLLPVVPGVAVDWASTGPASRTAAAASIGNRMVSSTAALLNPAAIRKNAARQSAIHPATGVSLRQPRRHRGDRRSCGVCPTAHRWGAVARRCGSSQIERPVQRPGSQDPQSRVRIRTKTRCRVDPIQHRYGFVLTWSSPASLYLLHRPPRPSGTGGREK
jgi:hypothetical protein